MQLPYSQQQITYNTRTLYSRYMSLENALPPLTQVRTACVENLAINQIQGVLKNMQYNC